MDCGCQCGVNTLQPKATRIHLQVGLLFLIPLEEIHQEKHHVSQPGGVRKTLVEDLDWAGIMSSIMSVLDLVLLKVRVNSITGESHKSCC